MPLTVFSPFKPTNLDDDRRKMRYALAQQVGQAAQQGIGAIDKLGADMQAREKYQTELRFKNAAEERAKAEEARRAAQEGRDIERAGREGEKFNIEKQGIEREREAQDLTQAQGALRFLVKSGLERGMSPQEISRAAAELPATGAIRGDEEVEAEVARQVAEAKALADAKSKADKEFKLTEKDINSKIWERQQGIALEREKIESARQQANAKVEAAKLGMSDDMRKDFEANKSVEDYRKASIMMEKVNGSAAMKTAAGDMSLVFAVMKIMDPNTGVMEGDKANAQNAGSIPERIRSMYNAAVDGAIFTEKQRQDFLAAAKVNYAPYEQRFASTASDYIRMSRERGLPVQNVVGSSNVPVSMRPASQLTPSDIENMTPAEREEWKRNNLGAK